MNVFKELRKADFSKDVTNLYQSNPNQGSQREYEFIKNILIDMAPLNFLVFGCGRDSILWLNCNEGGKTIFLEDNSDWINMVRFKIQGIDIREIKYSCVMREWETLLDYKQRLLIELPEDVKKIKWDLIFVDAPCGVAEKDIGRMQSIYSASTLNCKRYLLHDCDRQVEQIYGDKYLGKCKIQFDKLRYYEQ